MAEAKVREKDFNLHTWFATIPMTDDIFLGLQAQNLARVEMSVLREWERKVLDEQRSDPGNYQGPRYRELLALSQMWVFGVYEFLRTWRERARELLKFEETLPSPYNGSIYWKALVGKDREQREIGRRELADKFLGLYSWHEDVETALALANEDKARRKRLQREARRLAMKSGKDGMADEFFRTAKEADHDEDHPALPTDPKPYFVKKPATYEEQKEIPKKIKRRYPRHK